MKARYSAKYLDGLFASDEYDELEEIASILQAAEAFDRTLPNCGLPGPLFAFLEGMLWLALTERSGAITYYEAVPAARQNQMRAALDSLGATTIAGRYAQGMEAWRDKSSLDDLDLWVQHQERDITRWLQELIRANRAAFEELLK